MRVWAIGMIKNVHDGERELTSQQCSETMMIEFQVISCELQRHLETGLKNRSLSTFL